MSPIDVAALGFILAVFGPLPALVAVTVLLTREAMR